MAEPSLSERSCRIYLLIQRQAVQHYPETLHCTCYCTVLAQVFSPHCKLVGPTQAMSWATAKILPKTTGPQSHYYCSAEARVTPALQTPNAQTQKWLVGPTQAMSWTTSAKILPGNTKTPRSLLLHCRS